MANEVYNIISGIQAAKNLSEIKNIKKLQGAKNAYRIKLSEHRDYRIGFILKDDTIFLTVFAPRKEIYKTFP